MSSSLSRPCPSCGDALRLVRAKATGEPFVGCSGFPHCRYTSAYDDLLEELHDKLDEALERAAVSECRIVVSSAARDLDRELRSLVFRFHPDRAGESVPAHEVTAALNELRERLQPRRASA